MIAGEPGNLLSAAGCSALSPFLCSRRSPGLPAAPAIPRTAALTRAPHPEPTPQRRDYSREGRDRPRAASTRWVASPASLPMTRPAIWPGEQSSFPDAAHLHVTRKLNFIWGPVRHLGPGSGTLQSPRSCAWLFASCRPTTEGEARAVLWAHRARAPGSPRSRVSSSPSDAGHRLGPPFPVSPGGTAGL